MARTREKVIFEVSRSFEGERPADEVFAEAFAAHFEALARLNRRDDTFVESEFTDYNMDNFKEEALRHGTTS